MSLYAAREDIADVTGFQRPKQQIRALVQMGIRHRVRPADGFPAVLCEDMPIRLPPDPERNGFVYLICCGETRRVKIGHTLDPHKRLSELLTGSPTRLRLVGALAGDRTIERQLHAEFRAHRIRGEWFDARTQIFARFGVSKPVVYWNWGE